MDFPPLGPIPIKKISKNSLQKFMKNALKIIKIGRRVPEILTIENCIFHTNFKISEAEIICVCMFFGSQKRLQIFCLNFAGSLGMPF